MAAPPGLRKACAIGDLAAVQQHLDSGESPNGLCDEKTGETLLFVAAQNGHDRVCQQLLGAGAFAYVNKGRFLDGANPLHMAAGKGHSLVVQALLVGRAVPDRADSHAGRTPLFYAASRGQHESVQMLLDAGSDPNWLDQQGVVPLYVAAQNGKALVVDLLLRAGALVDGVSTPGSGARRKGAPAFIPLHAAAKHGHFDCVRRLISNKADPRLETASGQTALHIAAQNGNREVAELLARKCVAAVNQPAADETTPLFVASSAGHTACCELLLRCHANPDTPDNRGVAPIAAAIKKGRASHAAVVAALLDAGCTYSQQTVQAASGDRPMAGCLALAENRRLVGAMQRLAWAQMLCRTATDRTGINFRERSRPQLVLAEPLLRQSAMQLPVVSLAVAGRTIEERARAVILMAAASRNAKIVAATLTYYREGFADTGRDALVSPALQHALASELAQLEASLGQLRHQDFRKKCVR